MIKFGHCQGQKQQRNGEVKDSVLASLCIACLAVGSEWFL